MDPAFSEPTVGELNRVRGRVFGQTRSRSRAVRVAAVAAAVLAVVAVYLWRQPSVQRATHQTAVAQPKKTIDRYRLALEIAPLRLPFAAAIVLRGKDDTVSQVYLKELGQALAPYRSSKYADAVAALAVLRKRYPKAVEPPFYEGVTRLLMEDANGSLAPLVTAQSIGGEALNDDIDWYLAVAYERTGQWKKSVVLLKRLCATEGVHRKAACDGQGLP
jgi:hypothetical protein